LEIAGSLKHNPRITQLDCTFTSSGSGEDAIQSALMYWKKREHLLAFLMGTHARLGENAPVRMLVDECVRELGCTYLELDCYS
jgi:hypothetical protein